MRYGLSENWGEISVGENQLSSGLFRNHLGASGVAWNAADVDADLFRGNYVKLVVRGSEIAKTIQHKELGTEQIGVTS